MFLAPAYATVPTKLPPDKEIGRTLFLQNCWQCHGKAGLGDGPLAEAVGATASIQKAYKPGADEDAAVALILDGHDKMPAFNQVFDKPDAKRILTWLTAVAGGEDPDAAQPPKPKDKVKPRTPAKDTLEAGGEPEPGEPGDPTGE